MYRAFDERTAPTATRSAAPPFWPRSPPATSPPCRRNDLASSPLAARLEELGALRADVSGAGPAVYGLFADEAAAAEAVRALGPHGWAWIGQEAW